MTQINNAIDNNFYWGVLSKEELSTLNQSINQNGFEKAIANHSFSARFDYALDPNRSNSIKFLYPEKKPYKVLEIGCGYGSLTVELSKKFDHVDAVDAVYPSLIFTEHRLEYERCTNVELHQVEIFEDSDFLSNFENNTYDLVIVNGVLEWVGSGLNNGNPKVYQELFLKVCVSKLKNDGLMFLGIENRFYPGWIKRDPHSKLPLTAIAPRKIANIISLVITRKPYRTYIYGFRSLLKTMRKSGLVLNTKLYVFHSYRSPSILFHDSHNSVKELLSEISPNTFSIKWRFFLRYGIKFKIIDLFIPTFTHVYGKKRIKLSYMYKYAYLKNGKLELRKWDK